MAEKVKGNLSSFYVDCTLVAWWYLKRYHQQPIFNILQTALLTTLYLLNSHACVKYLVYGVALLGIFVQMETVNQNIDAEDKKLCMKLKGLESKELILDKGSLHAS